MSLLIKNGTIVSESAQYRADIAIDGERIAAIGFFVEEDFDEVIDATGQFVLPGLIDVHTHMELQQSEKYRSVDDFFSGSVAAACGGTTTLIDHIGFGPKGCSLYHQIDAYKKKAEKAAIDYGFHGVFQHLEETTLDELADLIENQGIISFKAYTTYGFKMSDEELLQILTQIKISGGILTVHAENDGVTCFLRDQYASENKTAPIYHALSRPNETEAEAVSRLIYLSIMAGNAPLYFVHTSTKESLDVIRAFRQAGYRHIYVETCPQYLMLTEESYRKEGTEGLKYIMAPPLRKKEDQDALWSALATGEIQVVATDHCPFLWKEKLDGASDFRKAPGGAAGVEERAILLYSEGVCKGRITMEQYVALLASNPAKLFGLYPKKGELLPGSDADVVLLDPSGSTVLAAKKLHSLCDYSIYEGMEAQGRIRTVLLRGSVIVKDGNFLGERGEGRFLARTNCHRS